MQHARLQGCMHPSPQSPQRRLEPVYGHPVAFNNAFWSAKSAGVRFTGAVKPSGDYEGDHVKPSNNFLQLTALTDASE